MDWADEKAKSVLNLRSCDWPDDTGEGRDELLQDWRDSFAQALRDVQRETAEECCAIVAPPTDSGKYFSRAMQGKVRAIRERFGLKVRL